MAIAESAELTLDASIQRALWSNWWQMLLINTQLFYSYYAFPTPMLATDNQQPTAALSDASASHEQLNTTGETEDHVMHYGMSFYR